MWTVILAFLAVAHAATTTYSRCKVLDCASRFTLSWDVNATHISAALEAASMGWLALGLSPTGLMPNSDIILGAPSLVKDYFASANVQPRLDARQDVTLRSAVYSPASGLLRVEFVRPLRTGDALDLDVTPGAAQNVLWALNPAMGALLAADGSSFLAHSVASRGSTTLDFGAPSVCPPCPVGVASAAAVQFAVDARKCYGNGWPSAEAGGDRDGGLATPTLAQQGAAAGGGACLSSPDGVFSASWSLSPPAVFFNGTAPSPAAVASPSSSAPAHVYVTLRSTAGGWAALGFNRGAPAMAGSDVLVAWATPASPASPSCTGAGGGAGACRVFASAASATAYAQPALAGASGDVAVVDARVRGSDGVTIVLRRRLAPADAARVNLATTSVYVTWAYGATWGDFSTGAFSGHAPGARGASAAAVSIPATADACLVSGAGLAQAALSTKRGGLYAVHGAFMVIAWWGFMALGAAAARYRSVMCGAPEEEEELVEDAAPPKQPRVLGGGGGVVGGGVGVGRGRGYSPAPSAEPAEGGAPASSSTAAAPNRSLPPAPASPAAAPVAPWFKAHLCFMLAAAASAVIGLAAIEAALGPVSRERVAAWTAHQRAGVAALTLLAAQVALGAARPRHGAPLRGWWLLAHRATAGATLLAGWVAVPLGAVKIGESARLAALIEIAHVGGALLFVLVAEAVSCRRRAARAARRVARAPRGEDAGAEVVVSAASPAAPSAAAYAEADSEPVKASAAGAARAAPAPPPLRCFTPLAASAAAGAAAALATALGVTLAVFPRPASALSPGSTYTGAAPRVGYPGGEVDLCFRMPADAAYTVPAVDTSYSCRAFALPPGVPLSAVTFTPLINNTDLAHHMLLFASSADLSWTGDARGVFDCAGLSPQVQGPLYVWGAGAPAQTTPAGVGFRVGADAVAAGGYVSTGVGYVVLQIHYANPGLVAGRRDSSGVLMHVTDALRPIDAGMLWVQAGTETIRVPAGRATGQAGDCGATALSGLPPAASVNALTPSYVAFGALLHAHTLATRVWVEQWRGGVRLAGDPLGHDDLYSFGNQHMIPLTGTLAANDRIYVRCVWANTVAQGLVAGNALAAAGQTVTGGESTLQEMCMGFILYYPRVPGTGASASCGSTARTFCDDAGTGGLPRCATYA